MLGPVIAFGLAGILLGVALILPVVAFLRARSADQRVRDLHRRLDALEYRLGFATPPPPVIPPRATAPMPQTPRVSASQLPATASSTTAETTPGLEQLIGGRWLLFAGIGAVVLGMSYFVKFAFDNGWISEPFRVIGGAITGLALIGAGMRFWSRGLGLFGQALAGGGLVVLYVSIYAAQHFYRLIQQGPAFALMIVVTAGAAWLSDRQRSQPLAALAMIGGFATPLLVGGERGAQVVLFTYIAILIAGVAVLARRHAWPLLAAGSYVGTFALVIAWFFSSYEAGVWLRSELFLTLYACFFGFMLWALIRSGDRSQQSNLAIAALATSPLVYHVASINLLNGHPAAWLVYVVLFTAVGLVISQRARATWIRVTLLFIVGIPAMAWLQSLQFPGWYGPAVVTAVMLYGMHLAAQWEAAGELRELPVAEIVHSQANGLLLPLSLYLFLETRADWWNPWVMAMLAAWNAFLTFPARGRAGHMRVQFVALSATLSAVALVLAFDGPVIPVGWVAEGVLIGWLASRERSNTLANGSGVLIALGCLRLAELLTGSLAVSETPFLNSRALASALVIGLLAWLAWRLRDDVNPDVRGGARNAVIIAANLVALGFLTAEIQAWFTHRSLGDAKGPDRLAAQVALSVAWALYAVGLIATGIRRRYAPARYFAITLFAVTVVKVLAFDIAGLDRLYRMLSVLGVGVLLLVASYLYQRRAPDAQ